MKSIITPHALHLQGWDFTHLNTPTWKHTPISSNTSLPHLHSISQQHLDTQFLHPWSATGVMMWGLTTNTTLWWPFLVNVVDVDRMVALGILIRTYGDWASICREILKEINIAMFIWHLSKSWCWWICRCHEWCWRGLARVVMHVLIMLMMDIERQDRKRMNQKGTGMIQCSIEC